MPYQRKDETVKAITPLVNRQLYDEAVRRGFNMREVFNLALAALLDIDDENQIRYDSLREMKDRLTHHDYKKMIEQVQLQQEEEKREHAREEEKKESKNLLLEIIITKCRPKQNYLSSIRNAIEEGRDTSMLSNLHDGIKREANAAGLRIDDAEILSGIKEAVRRDWRIED